jgi:mono/diheme cytochrome c family protein
VTLQPGEIRTCSGCHGENARNQAGNAASQAKPEALRELMRHWKQTQSGSIPTRRNGSAPLSHGG